MRIQKPGGIQRLIEVNPDHPILLEGDFDFEEDSTLSPDWQSWQLTILTNVSVVQAFNSLPALVTSSLVTLIGQVGEKPDTINTISTLWSQISPLIPGQVRDIILDAAVESNLPQQFIDVI